MSDYDTYRLPDDWTLAQAFQSGVQFAFRVQHSASRTKYNPNEGFAAGLSKKVGYDELLEFGGDVSKLKLKSIRLAMMHIDNNKSPSPFISTSLSPIWPLWWIVRKLAQGNPWHNVTLHVIDLRKIRRTTALGVEFIAEAKRRKLFKDPQLSGTFTSVSQECLVFGWIPSDCIIASVPVEGILLNFPPNIFLREDYPVSCNFPYWPWHPSFVDQRLFQYISFVYHCQQQVKRFPGLIPSTAALRVVRSFPLDFPRVIPRLSKLTQTEELALWMLRFFDGTPATNRALSLYYTLLRLALLQSEAYRLERRLYNIAPCARAFLDSCYAIAVAMGRSLLLSIPNELNESNVPNALDMKSLIMDSQQQIISFLKDITDTENANSNSEAVLHMCSGSHQADLTNNKKLPVQIPAQLIENLDHLSSIFRVPTYTAKVLHPVDPAPAYGSRHLQPYRFPQNLTLSQAWKLGSRYAFRVQHSSSHTRFGPDIGFTAWQVGESTTPPFTYDLNRNHIRDAIAHMRGKPLASPWISLSLCPLWPIWWVVSSLVLGTDLRDVMFHVVDLKLVSGRARLGVQIVEDASLRGVDIDRSKEGGIWSWEKMRRNSSERQECLVLGSVPTEAIVSSVPFHEVLKEFPGGLFFDDKAFKKSMLSLNRPLKRLPWRKRYLMEQFERGGSSPLFGFMETCKSWDTRHDVMGIAGVMASRSSGDVMKAVEDHIVMLLYHRLERSESTVAIIRGWYPLLGLAEFETEGLDKEFGDVRFGPCFVGMVGRVREVCRKLVKVVAAKISARTRGAGKVMSTKKGVRGASLDKGRGTEAISENMEHVLLMLMLESRAWVLQEWMLSARTLRSSPSPSNDGIGVEYHICVDEHCDRMPLYQATRVLSGIQFQEQLDEVCKELRIDDLEKEI